MSGRPPSYKVRYAKSKNNNTSKRSKTFKDSSDNQLFTKDHKDFIMKVNQALKSPNDIENIKRNLLAANKRLSKLQKQLNSYIVLTSGSYFTDKVPKITYSQEGRPSYYKQSKYENKGKTIPYDKKLYVVVRRISLSIIDKVTGKSIYKAGSTNINQDSYNRFFRDLLNYTFSSIKTPMKELLNAFNQSNGFALSGFVDPTDSGSQRIAQLLTLANQEGDFIDQKDFNIIQSTMKALMFGGVNRTSNTVNIEFFSNAIFVNLFTNPSITQIFSLTEILYMLLNLSISYSRFFYKKSKTTENLQLLASIRANIVTIIVQINKLYSMNSDQISPIENTTSNFDTDPPEDMAMTDVFEEITGSVARNRITTSRLVINNSGLNTGNSYSSGNRNQTVSSNSKVPTILQNYSTTESSAFSGKSGEMISENLRNDYSKPIRTLTLQSSVNNIIIPSNLKNPIEFTKNVSDIFNIGQSNINSKTSQVSSEGRFTAKRRLDSQNKNSSKFQALSNENTPIPTTATSSKLSTGPTNYTNIDILGNVPDNTNQMKDITTPSNNTSGLFNSNIASSPSGVNSATTYMDKIIYLLGSLFTAVYALVSLINGENSDRLSLKNAFNAQLKEAGLTQEVPFADDISLPSLIIGLEQQLGNIVTDNENATRTNKSSTNINIDPTIADQMIKSLGKTKPDKSKVQNDVEGQRQSNITRKQLYSQLNSIKKYLSTRSNYNALALGITMSDVSESDEDIQSNSNIMNEVGFLKDIVSTYKTFLPTHENSILNNKMGRMYQF